MSAGPIACTIAKGGELKRRCGVDADDLRDILREICALDPRLETNSTPGGGAIIPNVFIQPSPGCEWQIELNPETLSSP
ncbi:hypothetical protein [Mesorhizobium captivum]|uniref:RNA polymerase factor sigma-54 n=1 Tax=Mesorhizobium captivum TaxID=3072319 RepID=UPI003D323096